MVALSAYQEVTIPSTTPRVVSYVQVANISQVKEVRHVPNALLDHTVTQQAQVYVLYVEEGRFLLPSELTAQARVIHVKLDRTQ